METNKQVFRVFIGGFPPNVKETELQQRFGKFPGMNIQNMKIVRNELMSELRGFAYIEISPPENLIKKTLDENCYNLLLEQLFETFRKVYNGTKWKGGRLRIEKANPTYLERLKKEWEEELKPQESHKNDETSETRKDYVDKKFCGKKILLDQEEENEIFRDNIKLEDLISRAGDMNDRSIMSMEKAISSEEKAISMEESSISSEESSISSNESCEEEQGVKEDKDYDENEKDKNLTICNERMKVESSNEPNNEYIATRETVKKTFKIDTEEKRKLANERRIEAMKKRNGSIKSLEKISIDVIGNSCCSNGKKIVFDSDNDNEDDYDDDIKNHEEKKKSSDLFSDSEEDKEHGHYNNILNNLLDKDNDNDNSDDERFRFRPEFEGEQGKKLFELQKRYGGDTRFKLDRRFAEGEFGDGDDDNDVDHEKKGVENTIEIDSMIHSNSANEENSKKEIDLHEEISHAMDILKDMFPGIGFPKQIASADSKQKNTKDLGWNANIRRYDPSQKSSQEMECKVKISDDDEEIKIEKLKNESSSARKPLPKTNDHQFFTASADLSNMFSRIRKNSEDGDVGEPALDGILHHQNINQNQFSLLALFEDKLSNESMNKGVQNAVVETKEITQKDDSLPVHFTESNPFLPPDEIDSDAEQSLKVMNENTNNNENEKQKDIKIPKKGKLEDLMALGAQFIALDSSCSEKFEKDWIEKRKRLTIDYKNKHKAAKRLKKQRNSQKNIVFNNKKNSSYKSKKNEK